jgi:outer membrane protein TolC
LNLAQLSAELANMNLNTIRAKASLGMESEYNLTKAEQDYKQKQNVLYQIQKTLDSEYIKLNQMIGLDKNERPVVIFPIELTSIEELNIDLYVTQQIDKDPYIELQKKAVEQAEFGENIYTYSAIAVNDSYEIRQTKIDKAKQARKIAKTQFELGMIIEDQLKAAELSVVNTEMNLINITIQYEQLKSIFEKPYLLFYR